MPSSRMKRIRRSHAHLRRRHKAGARRAKKLNLRHRF